MLKLRISAGLALMGAAAAATTVTFFPVTSPFAGPAQEGAEMMGMPKPTKHHELLMMGVGEWKGHITVIMPGMGEMKEEASESVEAIGGFHTRSLFKSNFMGMPFVGAGTMSYDPGEDEMVGTWLDGMTARPSIMRGEADIEKQTVEMKWEAPAEGQEGLVPYRMVTKFTGDAYTSKMYMGEGDSEVHSMTIEMKKQK